MAGNGRFVSNNLTERNRSKKVREAYAGKSQKLSSCRASIVEFRSRTSLAVVSKIFLLHAWLAAL